MRPVDSACAQLAKKLRYVGNTEVTKNPTSSPIGALTWRKSWLPFLLVSEIGYCIDVYANFARDGRPYAPFPDRRRFRITLEDLRDEDVRRRLAAIWFTHPRGGSAKAHFGLQLPRPLAK